MILLALLSLVLLGVGVSLVLRAVTDQRMRAAENLETIGAYGFSSRQAGSVPGAASARALFDDVADLVGRLVTRHLAGGREENLKKELMHAGMYSMSPRRLLGYQVLCAFTFPAAWIWFAGVTGFPGIFRFLFAFGMIAMGWMSPLVLVRRRARFRLEEIDRRLPELIDLLVVTVEAGLGLTGSMQIAAGRLKGPLGEELRLALQEQNFGLATSEALVNMLGRTETPGMRAFVRSIVQGESLGVSIGQILRNVSEDMRKRRRAAAEERAQKAPVKMLLPLVFLIFPAMFVVLLGPAAFAFIEAIGGGG